MSELQHDFPFDPSYGYQLEALLEVEPPPEPPGFTEFWLGRYEKALRVDPQPKLRPSRLRYSGMRVFELEYASTDGQKIRGWLLAPKRGLVRRAIVTGHGYGGIERPSPELSCDDALYLVPCFRGLARSACPSISSNPLWHVLHGIRSRESYIIGGCVEDLWTGVSALLQLHGQPEGGIGYMGVSFGGGIGALALPWEPRIARAHLKVPTFGHHPLRLELPTIGSGASVQALARRHRNLAETLAYYDAAIAARHIRQPMHVAAALFDPAVAPPGQFAIYNALPESKRLFVLSAGHFEHASGASEDRALLSELRGFFCQDGPQAPASAQPEATLSDW